MSKKPLLTNAWLPWHVLMHNCCRECHGGIKLRVLAKGRLRLIKARGFSIDVLCKEGAKATNDGLIVDIFFNMIASVFPDFGRGLYFEASSGLFMRPVEGRNTGSAIITIH